MKKNDKRYANLRERYMDGGRLYKHYWEMGDARSINKLVKMVKRETGIEPKEMGVWKAIWRWASVNQDAAWQIYHKWNPEDSFETWSSLLVRNIRTAWQFPNDAKLKAFYRNLGYSVTYKVIYDKGKETKFTEYSKAYDSWYENNLGKEDLETIVEKIK